MAPSPAPARRIPSKIDCGGHCSLLVSSFSTVGGASFVSGTAVWGAPAAGWLAAWPAVDASALCSFATTTDAAAITVAKARAIARQIPDQILMVSITPLAAFQKIRRPLRILEGRTAGAVIEQGAQAAEPQQVRERCQSEAGDEKDPERDAGAQTVQKTPSRIRFALRQPHPTSPKETANHGQP